MTKTIYSPYIQRAKEESRKQQKDLDIRWEQAWNLAQDIAFRLKTRYNAKKVIVFGSLLHRKGFRGDSDIDIAVSGIPPRQFFRAVYDIALGEEDFDIDIVDVEDCKPYIRQAIEVEGGIVMNGYLLLREKIKSEVEEIKRVAKKAQVGLEQASRDKAGHDFYLDSVALNLHSFYAGVEKVFVMIAEVMEEKVPSGNRWHRELLEQMVLDLSDVRPPVITGETQESLEEYLSFRHFVRNVYTSHLRMDKLEELISSLPAALNLIEKDLERFLDFLTKMGSSEAEGAE